MVGGARVHLAGRNVGENKEKDADGARSWQGHISRGARGAAWRAGTRRGDQHVRDGVLRPAQRRGHAGRRGAPGVGRGGAWGFGARGAAHERHPAARGARVEQRRDRGLCGALAVARRYASPRAIFRLARGVEASTGASGLDAALCVFGSARFTIPDTVEPLTFAQACSIVRTPVPHTASCTEPLPAGRWRGCALPPAPESMPEARAAGRALSGGRARVRAAVPRAKMTGRGRGVFGGRAVAHRARVGGPARARLRRAPRASTACGWRTRASAAAARPRGALRAGQGARHRQRVLNVRLSSTGQGAAAAPAQRERERRAAALHDAHDGVGVCRRV